MRLISPAGLRLGTWGAVRIRLHVGLVLFAAASGYLAWREASGGPAGLGGDVLLMGMCALTASLAWHIGAHVSVMRFLGGARASISVAPWGETGSFETGRNPRRALAIALAGPASSGLAMVLCGLGILAILPNSSLIELRGLMHPLAPVQVAEGGFPLALLKLTFWMNWLLVLLNALPAYPFDGGRAVRAALRLVLHKRTAQRAAAAVAHVAAVTALVLAFLVREVRPWSVAPAWVILGLLAMVLFFGARPMVSPLRRQKRRKRKVSPGSGISSSPLLPHALPSTPVTPPNSGIGARRLPGDVGHRDLAITGGENPDMGSTAPMIERPSPPLESTPDVNTWLSARREAERELNTHVNGGEECETPGNRRPGGPAAQTPQALSGYETPAPLHPEFDDAVLDEILARLHAGGMDSLSDADRRILERFSQRFRQKNNGAGGN